MVETTNIIYNFDLCSARGVYREYYGNTIKRSLFLPRGVLKRLLEVDLRY